MNIGGVETLMGVESGPATAVRTDAHAAFINQFLSF
jgi:hypothetical protein